MNTTWSKKDINYLKKHYALMPIPEISEKIGKTASAIKTKALKLGLKKLVASNSPFTPEKMKLLKELYPNTRNRDIAEILGVTESSIIAAGHRYKLRKTEEFKRECSSKGYFKAGQIPFNKGKKGTEYLSTEALEKMKPTLFKKGNLPPNTKEDGVITIRYDHADTRNGIPYKYIRIGLSRWVTLQKYNWEKKYGKIKKGYCLWCKNGDTLNCEPDNWELITRAENMKRNTVHNYPKEVALMVQLRGALNRQINKHRKKVNNEK